MRRISRPASDLVAQIDQPDGGKGRRIEVFSVAKNGVAKDTADALLLDVYAEAGVGDEQVVITPQPSTNSLIISAPAATYDDDA